MPLTFRTTLVAFMFQVESWSWPHWRFYGPPAFPVQVQPLLHLLPFGVMLFSGLFAWLFDRARVALTLLILLPDRSGALGSDRLGECRWTSRHFMGIVVSNGRPAGAAEPARLDDLYSKDRIRSTRTMVPVVGILVQATIVLGLETACTTGICGGAAYRVSTRALDRVVAALTARSSGLHVLSTGLLVFRFMESRSPLETRFAWTLVATAFTFFSIRWQWDPRGFLMTAAGVTTTLVMASYRAAHRDELTGLPDREALAQATQRWGRPYAVALLEVDQLRQGQQSLRPKVGDQIAGTRRESGPFQRDRESLPL
ncbi:MAG: hypothetical protein U0231_16350 [Nitrospiraceae bacterium]